MHLAIGTREYRGISRIGRFALVGLLWMVAANGASAQTNLMRIEEDWELELREPDTRLDAPQILIVLNPLGETSSDHFEVDLNHASIPNYSSGGLQIRAMSDGKCSDQQRLLDGQRLNTDADVIRWTQIVERQAAGFAFGIIAGSAASWGQFGDASTFVSLKTGNPSFNYSASQSVEHSGITYAGNRVERLTLCRVRLVDSSGASTELKVNRNVQ